MAITFTEIERCGEIALGRYNDGETFLTYEVRSPGTEGRTQIKRTPDLRTAAREYWNTVQSAAC